MTDDNVAITPKEAQVDIDPNELSLLDGFYKVNVKTITGGYEELKIGRLSLRNKIKFQRFIAVRGLALKTAIESGKPLTEEVTLSFDLDVIDYFFQLLFGDDYTTESSKLANCDTLHLTEIAGKIMKAEKLLGDPNEVKDDDDAAPAEGAENPTQD